MHFKPTFFFCFFFVTSAAVLRVPADFLNISAALAAASASDTVSVSAGLYTGAANCDLVINKNGLALVGVDGPAVTIIDCQQQRQRCLTVVGALGVRVAGLTLRNGQAPQTPSELSQSPSTRTSGDMHHNTRKTHRRGLPERRRSGGKWKGTVAVVKIVVDGDGELSYERLTGRSERPARATTQRTARHQGQQGREG